MQALADIARLIWPLVAGYGLWLLDRHARAWMADRAAMRAQRGDDVEALRKELVGVKARVNQMAMKQGFRPDD